MRGIVAFALLLVVAAGPARATAAPAEPCKDLKVAQAKAVLGASARLAEKVAFGERVCTVRYGGATGLTVRSESASDFDWVVAGLQEEPAYVKQLKPVALGDKGYSYDTYANVGGTPRFAQRVLFFRVGARMFSVDVSARRLLPAAKHLAIARHVARNARSGK
jgi:hypothetical protein